MNSKKIINGTKIFSDSKKKVYCKRGFLLLNGFIISFKDFQQLKDILI